MVLTRVTEVGPRISMFIAHLVSGLNIQVEGSIYNSSDFLKEAAMATLEVVLRRLT